MKKAAFIPEYRYRAHRSRILICTIERVEHPETKVKWSRMHYQHKPQASVVLILLFSFCKGQQIARDLRNNLRQDNYDSTVRPNGANSTALNVSFDILSTYANDKAFRANIEFGIRWTEPRLRFPTIPANSNLTKVVLDSSWRNILWLPDVILENLDRIRIQEQLCLPGTYFIINFNKTIIMVTRLSVTMACIEERLFFPHDTKRCQLKVTTFTSQDRDVTLQWQFVSVASRIMQNFRAEAVDVRSCTATDGNTGDLLGQRPCLSVELRLTRRPTFYIVTKYIPSAMVVLMSFGSFFIPVVVLSARLTLLVAAILSTVFLFEFALVPSTFSATINLWLLFCLLFVVGAFIEFFFALREHWKDKLADATNGYEAAGNNYKDNGEQLATLSQLEIDKRSRVLFPMLFALFVFLYIIIFKLST